MAKGRKTGGRRTRLDPNSLLLAYIRASCEKVGVFTNPHDPDFLFGVIVTWLGEHDAVLTGSGVEQVPREPTTLDPDFDWTGDAG